MFEYVSLSDIFWAMLIAAIIVYHKPKAEP